MKKFFPNLFITAKLGNTKQLDFNTQKGRAHCQNQSRVILGKKHGKHMLNNFNS